MIKFGLSDLVLIQCYKIIHIILHSGVTKGPADGSRETKLVVK